METPLLVANSIVVFLLMSRTADEVLAFVSAFFAGLLGYIGKRVGELLWRKFKTWKELREHGHNDETR